MDVELYNNKCFIKKISNEELSSLRKKLRVWKQSFIAKGEFTVEDLYNWKENSFPIGYFDELKESFSDINVEDHRKYALKTFNFNFKEDPVEMYLTQKEALEAIKKNNSGIIAKATGSGKSRLIVETIKYFGNMTLVVVPSKKIQDQLYNLIGESFGYNVVSKDNIKNKYDYLFDEESIDNKIEITNKDNSFNLNIFSNDDEYIEKMTIKLKKEDSIEKSFFEKRGIKKELKENNDVDSAKRKKKKQILKKMKPIHIICYQSLENCSKLFLDKIELVIIDESHHASANSIRKALLKMPNAGRRFFFSATPWRDMQSDQKLLVSTTGKNLIYELRGKDAVEKEIIAKPIMITIEPPPPRNPDGKTFLKNIKNHREVIERGIIFNETRNDCIVDEAVKHYENDRHVFIAVDEIDHLKILEERLKKEGVEVKTIYGDMGIMERSATEKYVTEHKGPLVTIGTMAVGEGADFPYISVVILASGGKSSNRFLQRVGRGSRRANHDKFYIIDFKDWFHDRLHRHYFERQKHFNDEFNDPSDIF